MLYDGFSTRRTVLKTGGALLNGLLQSQDLPSQPNIILILTDDQGYGDIARHGNPIVRTPNLDRLHDESVRFTDFHASPTCAPTRAALLTGRHEFRSGVTHTINERERLSLRATTVAQVLQRNGYSTGIFGKWHLGDAEAYQPGRRGFTETFIHGCGGIGQDYPGTCADAPGNTYFNPYILHNRKFEKTHGYCTDIFFRQAQLWMDECRRSKKPFFAMITPNAPHVPLQCPEEYRSMYADKLDDQTARYFGMVTNIDTNVGALLNHLEAAGGDTNTVVLFMTDNGGTGGVKIFNDGLRGAKGTPYSGGTRVPLFVRWKGRFAPGVRPQLAAHVDLFPTLCGLAGIDSKVKDVPALDGRNLLPLLQNSKAPWGDRLLFTHVGRWEKGGAGAAKYARCRVRSARFSMVSARSLAGPQPDWQLFDLQADRAEAKDVAAQYPAVRDGLHKAYESWWDAILPALENEDAVPPAEAPYKVLFKQSGLI